MKKNALLNIIKQICSMLFPLITFPYAVRVLGVEHYGKVNYCNSLVTYFSLLAALGLQNYAVREGARIRGDREGFCKLANQLFTVNCITSTLSYVLFLVFISISDVGMINSRLLIVQSMIIPFAALGCEWVNIIYEDYKYITIRYIFLQVVAICALFLLVREKTDYITYAAIMTFSQAGAGAINVFYIRKKYLNIKLVFRDIDFFRHIKVLIVLFAISLSSYIYINADTTMIGMYRGDSEVGLYSSATKIYNIIKMMINALVVVTLPRLSALLGEGNTDRYNLTVNKAIAYVAILAIPCAAGLALLSKEAIIFVCGLEYAEAHNALSILSVALPISSIAYIFSSGVLVPHKKEKTFFAITLIGAILNVVLNAVVIPMWGYTGAAFTTLLSEIIVMALTYIFAKKLFKMDRAPKWLVDALIGTLAVVALCVVTKRFIHDPIIAAFACAGMGAFIYLVVLLLRHNEQTKEMLSYVYEIAYRKKKGIV